MSAVANLFDKAIAASLPLIPKAIVRRFARRYVAGEHLEDAVARVKELKSWGASATLDVLGEEIESIEAGERARLDYLRVLEVIKDEALDANISIKLTAFGLKLDPEATYSRVRDVVQRAREFSNFVRIDMEDSSTTTATIEIYRRLRAEGFDNIGLVLQAYMRRSLADVEALSELVPSYRLCKGIYVEPEEVAYKEFGEVSDNFIAVLEKMLETKSYVGIATHDHALAKRAEKAIAERGTDVSSYEFQMLLGVDQPLGTRLMEAGHNLRVYVPFGDEWYLYCMRRLKENPKIGRYVLFGLFKR